MTRHRLLGLAALTLSLSVAFSCATKPIAKPYRQEAKAEDLTFPMVLQDPDAYVGDTVLWGGDIIEATNIPGGTRIVVLETPLSGAERPKGTQKSQGRFVAVSSKFLDPAIYKKGRKVTLAGVVAGKETAPLGDATYTYPVVTVKQLHLWKRRPVYSYYPYGWGWGAPFGYFGFGDFDEDFGEGEEGEEGDADRD